MKHYLINPTWRCQNQCSYCWVQRTVRQRPELYHAQERPWQDWAAALHRDPPDIVDVAGGEPFLWEGLADLIRACPHVMFALSTNGVASAAIQAFCDLSKAPNLNSINISFHPESEKTIPRYLWHWRTSALTLMDTGYLVHSNVVDYGDNEERAYRIMGQWKAKYILSPYENMDILKEKQAQGLCCEGGVNHLTVAPDGTAWPCLSTLRSPYWAETAIGNWLDDTIDLNRKPQPCHIYCIDHYILETSHSGGDMWRVNAHPCEGVDHGKGA